MTPRTAPSGATDPLRPLQPMALSRYRPRRRVGPHRPTTHKSHTGWRLPTFLSRSGDRRPSRRIMVIQARNMPSVKYRTVRSSGTKWELIRPCLTGIPTRLRLLRPPPRASRHPRPSSLGLYDLRFQSTSLIRVEEAASCRVHLTTFSDPFRPLFFALRLDLRKCCSPSPGFGLRARLAPARDPEPAI